MKLIRFEKSKVKTTYVVNLDLVLWIEFPFGSEAKIITLHFAGEKSLSVAESEVGEDKFRKLMTETYIKETGPSVRAIR
ncbi:MAG: hypothetical protein WCB96_11920 [Candidatus Aminicenantales bacterium]